MKYFGSNRENLTYFKRQWYANLVENLKKIMKSMMLKSQTNYGFYELILTLQTTDARDEIVKNVSVYSLFPKHQR
jgi:uncharacterized protein YheU (UPF0270 family)